MRVPDLVALQMHDTVSDIAKLAATRQVVSAAHRVGVPCALREGESRASATAPSRRRRSRRRRHHQAPGQSLKYARAGRASRPITTTAAAARVGAVPGHAPSVTAVARPVGGPAPPKDAKVVPRPGVRAVLEI